MLISSSPVPVLHDGHRKGKTCQINLEETRNYWYQEVFAVSYPVFEVKVPLRSDIPTTYKLNELKYVLICRNFTYFY